jgi:branched-chain amino acid transport system substrate-binding protein
MKIGILVPQSKVHATIGKNFVNGIKMVGDFTVIVEGIGYGDNPKLIADKMDKFSMQDDVDCIVGLVGDRDLTSLYEKANALELLAIFARLGAFPDVNIPDNKFAFSLSLNTCNAISYLGPWFQAKNWRKIGVSGSFNDVGYGFLKSLEDALILMERNFLDIILRHSTQDLMKQNV